jgi:hypothetical protein
MGRSLPMAVPSGSTILISALMPQYSATIFLPYYISAYDCFPSLHFLDGFHDEFNKNVYELMMPIFVRHSEPWHLLTNECSLQPDPHTITVLTETHTHTRAHITLYRRTCGLPRNIFYTPTVRKYGRHCVHVVIEQDFLIYCNWLSITFNIIF